jgi:hypothetical protein
VAVVGADGELAAVSTPFVKRQIARQLAAGRDAERLHHRLTARFAKVMLSEIHDPGRLVARSGPAAPR